MYKRTTDTTPPPGSYKAKADGCICSVDMNLNGLGVHNGDGTETFYVDRSCTIHKTWPSAALRSTAAAVKQMAIAGGTA